ncbi:hypothetical protein TWF694_004993 [Orbilia ellipsospora]|uniref:Uncharacterized protein n=1 Tax=Orbilia ellipsospora TaxID=2528407 RepID=A0AAV9WWD5_9PEZI
MKSILFTASILAATAAATCPATFDAGCQYFCTWPVASGGNSGCYSSDKSSAGATCTLCPAKPTACPATFSDECPFFCNGGECSYVNITTQNTHCEKCPGQTVKPTACPTTFDAGAAYFCEWPVASGGNAGYYGVDHTDQGAKCTVCPGKPTACPAVYTDECPFFCDNIECSYVNITTMNTKCIRCPGGPAPVESGTPSSSAAATATASLPAGPVYTGAASAANVGASVVLGFVAMFFAF